MSPRGVCPKETSAPAPSDTFGTDSTMVQVQRSIPTPASCSQHQAKDGFSTQLISLGPLFFWLRCLCPGRTSFHPSPGKSSRGSALPEPPIWQSESHAMHSCSPQLCSLQLSMVRGHFITAALLGKAGVSPHPSEDPPHPYWCL